MWKLLRNLLLAGVLIAGALKLLAWYEVRQDAERIATALAPYAQIRYDSVSAGLDGSASFTNLSAAFKRDKNTDTYAAEQVVIETPGVFWLLKRSLMSDASLPAHFGISVRGLKIPPTPWLDPHWFNPTTLVPFETAGCAAVTLSPADYRKMEVSVGDVREHGEFRYDADARALDVTVTLTTAGIATLTLDSELRQFEPKMLESADALKRVHVGRLGLSYSDSGFFKRRNQFCAQRGNIGPSQFVEQHVAAVQALLQQRGIEPSTEVLKLYRRLVENGGQASVLSLPNSTFVAGAWQSSSEEDLLRQMNVTARYGDTPPVMFRLSFAAPPAPAEPATTAVADATAPAATPTPTPTPGAVPTTPTAVPAQTTTPVPATRTIASATVAPVTPPPAAAPADKAPAPPAPSSANPPPVKPAATTPDKAPAPSAAAPTVPAVAATAAKPAPTGSPGGGGLEEFDKAAAKLAPLPKRQPSGAPEFQPSQPAPAAGSTLALVWKPTIERLPPPPPERRDYDIIDFAALKGEHGRFVRLITEGGKKVEGYVVSSDDTDVQLRVSPSGGNAAQFSVPKARIQEIQLVHRSSPPA